MAGDGADKLPVRILATGTDRLVAGGTVDRLAVVVAAYAACLVGPRHRELNVSDPTLSRLLTRVPGRDDAAAAVDRLLSLEAIFGTGLPADPRFRRAVHRYAPILWRGDVGAALKAVES